MLNRSNSIDVPDFTAGAWKRNKPNMDINLDRGATRKFWFSARFGSGGSAEAGPGWIRLAESRKT